MFVLKQPRPQPLFSIKMKNLDKLFNKFYQRNKHFF